MKKYIVITGASSGIGAAAAKAFARRGENLILIARRVELLQNLKDEIAKISPESDVVIKICDLACSENVLALWDELKKLRTKGAHKQCGLRGLRRGRRARSRQNLADATSQHHFAHAAKPPLRARLQA